MLLVDDDKFFTLMAKTMVTKTGLHSSPKAFENGFVALEYLKNNYTPQEKYLIFLDINMPDMNGWEVLDVVAKTTSEKLPDNVRIYVLSSSINTSDKVKAYSNPLISGFFEKPLLQEDLRNLLFGEHVASMDRLWIENTERRKTDIR